MKIVLAPNAFKDSLSAIQACHAMAKGIRNVIADAEIISIPIADGGDGLVDIALHVMKGNMETCHVHDPLGRIIEAGFCHVPEKKLSIIEMATGSGLRLLTPEERDPLKTSTFGTGELIKTALDYKSDTILVGLGGSATNDGGTGMAAALGVAFFDKDNKKIVPNGENLSDIYKIDMTGLDKRIKQVSIEAICDVNNTLLGEKGAAVVYSPQKGASPKQVKTLEAGLANLADRIETDLKKEVRTLVSGGAAGGLGAGLFSFLEARLRPGIDVVLDLVNLDDALEGADLLFTGEGQLDEQTAYGKAPSGAALKAKKRGIPCIAIAGSMDGDLTAVHATGISAVFSLCPGPVTLEQAMKNADSYIATAVEHSLRAFLAGVDSKGD